MPPTQHPIGLLSCGCSGKRFKQRAQAHEKAGFSSGSARRAVNTSWASGEAQEPVQASGALLGAADGPGTQLRQVHSERGGEASAAHEIANPLSIISGNLQLWHESTGEEEAIGKGDIELVLREVERCMNVTRQLRDLSCSPPARKELVGINSLLRNIMFLMEAEFRYRKVTVRTRLREGVPCIRGDAGRLQQLLVNLVLNGVQAMRAGGVLSVETAVEEDGLVTVRITDTGRGIPSGLIQRIFAPFFTTRQEEGGTGLGLMVVQQVLQEHGGDVNVESCPGKGTTFTVSLPAANGSRGGVAET